MTISTIYLFSDHLKIIVCISCYSWCSLLILIVINYEYAIVLQFWKCNLKYITPLYSIWYIPWLYFNGILHLRLCFLFLWLLQCVLFRRGLACSTTTFKFHIARLFMCASPFVYRPFQVINPVHIVVCSQVIILFTNDF